jgi:hypothetical protein
MMQSDGGNSQKDGKEDDNILLDHAAMHIMHSVHKMDVKGFRDGLHAIIAHHMASQEPGEEDFKPHNEQFETGGKS